MIAAKSRSHQREDMVKRVALAADHAGFELKEKIAGYLEAKGFEVMDLGTHDEEPADYPTQISPAP
jgi:ribose 5-phosphate isomerase B